MDLTSIAALVAALYEHNGIDPAETPTTPAIAGTSEVLSSPGVARILLPRPTCLKGIAISSSLGHAVPT